MEVKRFNIVALVIIAINITIGTWSIIEMLSWFGKSIPLIVSIIIGLVVAEFSIPVAVIGWILRICGVF